MDRYNNNIKCNPFTFNNSKGCLVVTAFILNENIHVITLHSNHSIHIKADILNNPLIVIPSRIGEGLKINCSVVCSIPTEYYLNVSTNTLWLTPEMLSNDFDIYSNVNWKIDIPVEEEEELDILRYVKNDTIIINRFLFKNLN